MFLKKGTSCEATVSTPAAAAGEGRGDGQEKYLTLNSPRASRERGTYLRGLFQIALVGDERSLLLISL